MYAGYRFKLLHDEDQILSGHKPDRRRFLSRLFRTGKKGREWVTLTVEEAAMELGTSRERIVKALCWLEEAGEIALKPSGVRQRFRLNDSAASAEPRDVANQLADVFLQREARDIARLDEVQRLAESRRCLVRGLLKYFGESMG
jgi:ATP-dependent DNA helicase RecQ